VQELEKGRDYLEGRGVPKDSTLAAKWLWKSVAKQNTEATVILSQLYVSGNGVPKSCDQARLLLSAVAEKGSDGARQQLKDVVASCH
jgi:TPR repeat protein